MNDLDRFPPLLGLFRELLANGTPVGVRDYLDGLRALQLGFGHNSPDRLLKLALALWSRSDEEHRLISRYFGSFPELSNELIQGVEQVLLGNLGETKDQDRKGSKQASWKAGVDSPLLRLKQPIKGTTEKSTSIDEVSRALVSFSNAQRDGGLPLPNLVADPYIAEEYLLKPQTQFRPRDLAVLWRRYRRSTRHGPRSELDLAATIHDRCRQGYLSHPVCRSRRTNSARLLILSDVSASMDPWQPFVEMLPDSLTLGRLASAKVYYFSNLPRNQLFAAPALTEPISRDEVLRQNTGAGVLVISDAGSSRGYLNRRRALQTSKFLAEFAGKCPSIVWLNPMPRSRWAGTTAGLIASSPAVTMLPLNPPQLMHAIDILRGNR